MAHSRPVDNSALSGSPSSRHQELIQWAVAYWPGAKTKRFRSAIKPILYDPDISDRYKAIPDAYRIDENEQRVEVFEVECEHPIPSRKLRLYTDLAWALDETDWRFLLYRIDRLGCYLRFDLMAVDAHGLMDKVRHDPRSPFVALHADLDTNFAAGRVPPLSSGGG